MSTNSLQSIHYDGKLPHKLSEPFDITCPSHTDVWNKPPSIHSFNAPIIYQHLQSLKTFKSAQVTVSASWTDKYDQGGLCMIMNPLALGPKQTWIKTGIEFLNDQAHVSTVATSTWSDWSLTPIPDQGSTSATVKMESNEDGSLWVYMIRSDGSSTPIREIAWWADLDKDSDCWLGVYAAKPAAVDSSLSVHFKEFNLETS